MIEFDESAQLIYDQAVKDLVKETRPKDMVLINPSNIDIIEYKVCCIYCIRHIDSGMRYIGRSNDVWRRYTRHCRIYDGNGVNTLLGRMLQKHGLDKFSFEIIEICEPINVKMREIYWISFYNTAKEGMNMQGLAYH